MQVVITSLNSATDKGGTNLSVQMTIFRFIFPNILCISFYLDIMLHMINWIPQESLYYLIKSYGFL
jgi:hypothetical protein